jgi:ubiquinone/menaquinone biosynthesis C-methylase UbiE
MEAQLSTLSPQDLQAECDAVVQLRDETAVPSSYQMSKYAVIEAARRALQSLTPGHLEQLPIFLRKYTESLERQLGTNCLEKYPSLSDEALESLLLECEAESSANGLIPLLARNLGVVLRAETVPVQLFSAAGVDTTSALSQMFGPFVQDGRLSHFLDLASHENPGLKVLEVGGGSGAVTRQVLNALQGFETETGQARFSEYAFTDIVSTEFDAVQKEFLTCQERMAFKLLNLENAPTDQGFEAAGYDLIVAANAIHATRDLKKSLNNLHGLLKPGGRLILIETVSPHSALINVGFGCLEDWWVAEEPERQHSSVVTEERWGELMRETGFSGTDLITRDCQNPEAHYSSIMFATALDPANLSLGSNGVSNGPGLSDEPDLVVLINATSDV